MLDALSDSTASNKSIAEGSPTHGLVQTPKPEILSRETNQVKLVNTLNPEPFIDTDGEINTAFTLNVRNNHPVKVVFFDHKRMPSFSDDLAKGKTTTIYGNKPKDISQELWDNHLQEIRLKSARSGAYPAFETEAIQNGEALFFVADDPTSILDFCIRLGIDGSAEQIEEIRSNNDTQTIISGLMSALYSTEGQIPNQHLALLASYIRGDDSSNKIRELLSGNCPISLIHPDGNSIDAILLDRQSLVASGACPKALSRLAFVGKDLLSTSVQTRVEKQLIDFSFKLQREQSHLGVSASKIAETKWKRAKVAGLPIVDIEVVDGETITMPDVTKGGKLKIYGKGAMKGLDSQQQLLVQEQAEVLVQKASENGILLPHDDPFVAIVDSETGDVRLLLLDFITLGVDNESYIFTLTGSDILKENQSLASKALRFMY